MREVIPRVAALAVILAHGPPLALAQVGAPLFPRNTTIPRLSETVQLCWLLVRINLRIHLSAPAEASSVTDVPNTKMTTFCDGQDRKKWSMVSASAGRRSRWGSHHHLALPILLAH